MTIYRYTNEGIRNRWREAGGGQVRERNGKLLEVGTEKLDSTHESSIFKIKQETRELKPKKCTEYKVNLNRC